MLTQLTKVKYDLKKGANYIFLRS